jgi:PIN domain
MIYNAAAWHGHRRNLRKTLGDVRTAVRNLWSGGAPGMAQDRVAGYLEWVTSTVQQLGAQISSADLDRLVLTRGYDRLLSAAGTMTGTDIATQRVLNGLVSLELTQRVDAFDAAVKALDEQIQRWSRPGVFVAADTSFYIEHESKLENVDFRPLLQIWEDPVHLLVPIVVVDELDSLKKSKTRHERWRARLHTGRARPGLRQLDWPGPADSGRLLSPRLRRIPRGEITIELVFDPRGHVRLPINDDEIIDRVMAVEPLAAREVTLLIYDTGQSTRARNAGLRVKKLVRPAESEPASTAQP